jgi:two-component system, chemotaxis family, protein-glutamate methylesterase/glutaminase
MSARRPIQALVIGGSAGAIDVLGTLLPALPAGLSVPVVVVVHVPPDRPSYLPEVLGARTVLPVREAEDKEPVEPGVIYVAPPNYHLLVERSHRFALSVDAPVHFSRPAIDVLFESAAVAWGEGLAAVLLTGASADGAIGLERVRASGGLTAVQAPDSATARTMPDAALARMAPDHVLAPEPLGALLAALGAPPAGAA